MTVSNDTSAPLVVISGITGNQGGSVYRALKDSAKSYRIKGITRDPSKPNAKRLADEGVELAALTLSADAKEATTDVFKGADYTFAVTDFWQHTSLEREVAEGKMIVDAAKAANTTLIFSGLPSYKELSKQKYLHVDHFEGKAQIVEYAKSIGAKIIDVQPAMYLSNFTGGMAPRKGEDGNFVQFALQGFGDARLSLIDIARDYGLFVQAAIEQGYKSGDTIYAVGTHTTGKDIVKAMEKKSGQKINIVEVPHEAFQGALAKQMGPTIATEFMEMLAAHFELGYYGQQDTDDKLPKLARKTTSSEEYVNNADWSKVF